MRYAEITEAFASPVAWRWTERGRITWAAQFKIGKMLYTVYLENTSRHSPTALNFDARDTTDKSQEWGTQHATGTGNAFAVYSTVLDIVAKYLASQGGAVRELEIQSDTTERSRHAVNRRLAQKIAEIGHFDEIEDDGSMILLKRSQANLSETQLTELFPASDVSWDEKSDHQYTASFEVGEIPYVMAFNRFKTGVWGTGFEIEASWAKANGITNVFGSTGISGMKSVHVFSRVISLVANFINAEKPDILFFTGLRGDGHSDLYRRMAEHMKERLWKAGYVIETINRNSSADGFKISKLTPDTPIILYPQSVRRAMRQAERKTKRSTNQPNIATPDK